MLFPAASHLGSRAQLRPLPMPARMCVNRGPLSKRCDAIEYSRLREGERGQLNVGISVVQQRAREQQRNSDPTRRGPHPSGWGEARARGTQVLSHSGPARRPRPMLTQACANGTRLKCTCISFIRTRTYRRTLVLQSLISHLRLHSDSALPPIRAQPRRARETLPLALALCSLHNAPRLKQLRLRLRLRFASSRSESRQHRIID